jgi:hypothetical protein
VRQFEDCGLGITYELEASSGMTLPDFVQIIGSEIVLTPNNGVTIGSYEVYINASLDYNPIVNALIKLILTIKCSDEKIGFRNSIVNTTYRAG